MHNPADFYCVEKPLNSGSHPDSKCLVCRNARLVDAGQRIIASRGSAQLMDELQGRLRDVMDREARGVNTDPQLELLMLRQQIHDLTTSVMQLAIVVRALSTTSNNANGKK